MIIATISSIILGTVLHFTYKLSNCNKIVAIFSSTNERTWEHLKLAFFPIIVVGIFEYFIIRGNANNIITSKMIASILSMIMITILFYTYTKIIGKDNFILDIAIFIISIVTAQIVSYKIMEFQNFNLEVFSIVIIMAIMIIFARFTNFPPKLRLFLDPIDKKYGPICK